MIAIAQILLGALICHYLVRKIHRMLWWRRYRRYMRSPAWQERRNRSLWLAGYRCQALLPSGGACGRGGRLHCHHISYRNLGHERDEDILVTCYSCHRCLHPGRVF